MMYIGSFLLSQEVLDDFKCTQSESDCYDLLSIPIGHPIFQTHDCVSGIVGANHSGPHFTILTFVKNSGVACVSKLNNPIIFTATRDVFNLKCKSEYKVVIANICEYAFGVSVNLNEYHDFVESSLADQRGDANTSNLESIASTFSSKSTRKQDQHCDLDDASTSILEAVASSSKDASSSKRKKRRVEEVHFGDKGILRPSAATDAAQSWMEKHGGSFVSIDLVPQRGKKGEESVKKQFQRRYRVHDVAKDQLVTVRTLPECLDLVMSKVGRNFWHDMKNQPEQYNLSFEDKDFAVRNDSRSDAGGSSGVVV